MGKNRILDPSNNSKIRILVLYIKKIKIFGIIGLFIFLIISLGCLPKIIISRDPLTPEEHLNLGVAYERKGELDIAIREYELAAKKLPLAYLYLGNAFFLKNELEIAKRYYKEAIKKDPTNADAYNNLAWLYYIKKENLDDAEILIQIAIRLNPQKESIYKDTLEKIQELKKIQSNYNF